MQCAQLFSQRRYLFVIYFGSLVFVSYRYVEITITNGVIVIFFQLYCEIPTSPIDHFNSAPPILSKITFATPRVELKVQLTESRWCTFDELLRIRHIVACLEHFAPPRMVSICTAGTFTLTRGCSTSRLHVQQRVLSPFRRRLLTRILRGRVAPATCFQSVRLVLLG